ncbi:uncharacterized protein [Bactrocera oleae]|uniref:uncharacterized protein n=1 Tax=Bactrocera oleae TaxID=104688 RepID=UPI00387ECF14
MWTYMMAATRGERANMMMSASRRRNESESPKYGYNVGRSMPYRSTARQPLHSSASSTLPSGAYTSYPHTTTTTPYYESHHLSSSQAAAANLPSASTSAASTASPPPFHIHAASAALHRLPPHNSSQHHVAHATATIDEDGISLFSPLSPCMPFTAAVDKDTHIFVYKGAKAKTARKRLIANHVGEIIADVPRRISMEISDEEDAIGLVDEVERRRRCLRAARRKSCAEPEIAGVSVDAGGGKGSGSGRNDASAFSSGVEDDSGEEDYLELESGKRMSQDQIVPSIMPFILVPD